MLKKMVFLSLVLLMLMALPALADNQHKIVFTINELTYTVDNSSLTGDAYPIYADGRAYVPLRFLANALGAKVNWNGANVLISAGNINLTFSPGQKTYYINQQSKTMDVAPLVMPPGRLFLPARYVAEALGYQVLWDDSQKTVTITNYDQTSSSTSSTTTTPVPQNTNKFNTAKITEAPFALTVNSLKLAIGDSNAYLNPNQTGATNSPAAATVALPETPYVAATSAANQTQIASLNPLIYGKYPPVLDTDLLTQNNVYVPVTTVLEAFGLPETNVSWDGNELDLCINKKEYLRITKGQLAYQICNIDGNDVTETYSLAAPLRVVNNTPMMSADDILNISSPFFGRSGNVLKYLDQGYIVINK